MVFRSLCITCHKVIGTLSVIQKRYNCKFIEKPKIGHGRAFRRVIHFKNEYTIEPLKVTNLAGRDLTTGRVVCKGIGGGVKHEYHWIKWEREGPLEGAPKLEKVIDVVYDGCRTAKVALVGVGDELKYIIATENMTSGDIIKTSHFIPRIPVRPNEGDAYPLGGLSIGTRIHCLQQNPGYPTRIILAAGTFGTILRKIDGKVIVQLPSKREFAYDQKCIATVGRVSNVDHNKEHIGSPQRLRELGYRPRSGLWQRKSGRHGRKIKKLPPVKTVILPSMKSVEPIKFSLHL